MESNVELSEVLYKAVNKEHKWQILKQLKR